MNLSFGALGKSDGCTIRCTDVSVDLFEGDVIGIVGISPEAETKEPVADVSRFTPVMQ